MPRKGPPCKFCRGEGEVAVLGRKPVRCRACKGKGWTKPAK